MYCDYNYFELFACKVYIYIYIYIYIINYRTNSTHFISTPICVSVTNKKEENVNLTIKLLIKVDITMDKCTKRRNYIASFAKSDTIHKQNPREKWF